MDIALQMHIRVTVRAAEEKKNIFKSSDFRPFCRSISYFQAVCDTHIIAVNMMNRVHLARDFLSMWKKPSYLIFFWLIITCEYYLLF